MTPVRAVLLAAFLAVSTSSPGQDNGAGAFSGQETIETVSPHPPAAKQPPQGSIAGHVYLADTHGPARGARLMVVPFSELGLGTNQSSSGDGQPHMAVTALDGSFYLPHVPAGQYVVLAFAAGYLSPLDGLAIPNGPEAGNQTDVKALEKKVLELAPTVRVAGPEAARIEIELERGAALSGRVIYSDGSPAGQLQVSVQKSGDQKPAAPGSIDIGSYIRTLYLQQRPTTDDQGHFRIAGITPGSYLLAVAQDFEGSADFSEELMNIFGPDNQKHPPLTIYSGNTLHRKDAKVYDLKAGDSMDGIEITLPLSGLRSIRGTVTGQDGTPLNYGSLDLVDTADSTITFHAAVEVDGQFRFSGIPEGTYDLKATSGRVFENPPDANLPAEMVVQQPQQFKPLRAFADTKVAVVVQSTDLDDFRVTLTDTKIPEPPKQPQFLMPPQPVNPSQP